jgi:hypothetical protein
MNQELLEMANNRYYFKNNIEKSDYYDDMDDFILQIYIQCDPASYGKQFVRKIIHDSDESRIYEILGVSDSSDEGDISITFDNFEFFCKKETEWVLKGKRLVPMCKVILDNIPMKTIEVKISYLGKNESYTIRNIRPYQDFNYFLLCFVDCKDNFKQTFVLVNKEVITNSKNITLTPMNGTKNINEGNVNIGYGTAFNKYSDTFDYIKEKNILNGTNYTDVLDFFETEANSQRQEVLSQKMAA